MKSILFSFIATTAAAQYTGTYDTHFIRSIWTGCYQGALLKRIDPGVAQQVCDCVIDETRKTYHQEDIDKMSQRIEIFTEMIGLCSEIIKWKYSAKKPV
tara:strand:+ start:140 stop:436 length:297 start_codon:yes stop_codon:yes gene_type:complete